MTVAEHPKLITLPEAAEELGLCRATIWNYVQAGLFPSAARLGRGPGRWHVSSEDVDALRPTLAGCGRPSGPRPRQP